MSNGTWGACDCGSGGKGGGGSSGTGGYGGTGAYGGSGGTSGGGTGGVAGSSGAGGSSAVGGSSGAGGGAGEQPIGDAGCMGDPNDDCAYCLCTSCWAQADPCWSSDPCAAQDSSFGNCVAQDNAVVATCRAAVTDPMAQALEDCLIANCGERKCL